MHIDVNNAFLSWSAIDLLNNGSKYDIRDSYAVIGGDPKARKGIVLAKSTPAKKRGVKTAETLFSAKKKCPALRVYPPNFNFYHKMSEAMFDILANYTSDIEIASIDECYLDYGKIKKINGDEVAFAYKIQKEIYEKLGFTVNVGVAHNKLLAKMASDFSKPDKVHTLFSNEIKDKMWGLPIEDLFMIGRASSKKLRELGINTINDLAHTDREYLARYFKSMSKMMWEYANGIDESLVESDYGNPKSISNSCVLPYNYSNIDDIYQEIKRLSEMTGKKLREKKMYSPNVMVWVKFDDFTKISKQLTLDNLINSDKDIYECAIKLFNKTFTTLINIAINIGIIHPLTTNLLPKIK